MAAEQVLAEVFPPGEFIRDELEARGWSQLDLAEILGRTPAAVNELVQSKRAVTPETAKALEQAFGVTAQFWMNVEARWQLARAKTDDAVISRRAKLYTKAPIKEMIRRGWIQGSASIAVLEKQVVDFFECKALDDDFEFGHAARKSASYTETTPAQCAWLFRAKHLARTLRLRDPWQPHRVGKLVNELQKLTLSPEAAQHVPAIFGAFGVRFVLVESLPQAKMDGASFWLSKRGPVIALALRYDRIDNFWHTTMHELGHIAQGTELSVDVDVLSQGQKPRAEALADKFAVESLIPPCELDDFCAQSAPLFSHVKIKGFAAHIRVHPGIVVGQLHHRQPSKQGLEYSYFRRMLVPVRKFIIPAALTDGWGTIVPM